LLGQGLAKQLLCPGVERDRQPGGNPSSVRRGSRLPAASLSFLQSDSAKVRPARGTFAIGWNGVDSRQHP
jgi:hypothetical protein